MLSWRRPSAGSMGPAVRSALAPILAAEGATLYSRPRSSVDRAAVSSTGLDFRPRAKPVARSTSPGRFVHALQNVSTTSGPNPHANSLPEPKTPRLSPKTHRPAGRCAHSYAPADSHSVSIAPPAHSRPRGVLALAEINLIAGARTAAPGRPARRRPVPRRCPGRVSGEGSCRSSTRRCDKCPLP
jgi:hypothetical protein